jgi:sulfur carrier protein ThiS
MKVTLKLYATLTDYLPPAARRTNAMPLELAPETTVADCIGNLNLPNRLCHLVLVDGVFIPPADRLQRALREGETLAIWPPIAGG